MTAQRTGASWYDLLGVAPDATPEQIKAAWRDATDRFEPGSGTGQFRLFNEAADVLLDPDRRAAYDAEIAPPPSEQPDPVDLAEPRDVVPAPEPHVLDVPQAGPVAESAPARLVPLWTIAVLTVLVIAFAAVGAVFAVRHHQDAVGQTAGDEASAAAERALPAVLSYDYRRLTADRKRADAFLTPAYRKEYDATFSKLIESNGTPGPAAQTKAVVKATVQQVGVVQAQPDRVRVIAFVNQTTTKGTAVPTLSLNRLTVSMKHVGNAWLLDDITSY